MATRKTATKKSAAKKTTARKSTARKATKRTVRKRPTKTSASEALAAKKVEKVMHERKAGTLRSGSGKKVTSRKQAIAIGLSEARKAGAKIPRKRTG